MGPYKIGPASADVRIGSNMVLENGYVINLARTYSEERPYWLAPGQFVLLDMYEETYVPLDLTAEFKLKSTRAREGYNHALAGFIDPGWKGILTLEIKNNNVQKSLPLYPRMPIGQLIYFQTIGATEYVGRYQGTTMVAEAREEV